MAPSDQSQRLRDAHAWIGQQKDAAFDRLIRWCDQNSWSMDAGSLAAMASLLTDDFADVGVRFTSVELPPLRLLGDTDRWQLQPTGPMLVWHHQPESPRRLLLMIHYDTVYPLGAMPDRCRRDGDRLIGPGTADAKGGIAVIALAVEAILKFDLASNIGVSIVLNPDEEIGTTASGDAIRVIVDDFDRALLFEPTLPDGSLVAARKGSGNFAIIVQGRSAHAGRNPGDGRNAIVHLAKIVDRLSQMNAPENGITLNVGNVTGGGPLNRVPDHAAVQFNVRVADAAAQDHVTAAIGKIATQFTGDGYVVKTVGEFHSPPKLVDEAIAALQADVARAAAPIGRTIAWRDTGGACDGSKLAAWGLPNIDTMSVTGGGLHSPDEFCDLDSLVPAASTVVNFVANMNVQACNDA